MRGRSLGMSPEERREYYRDYNRRYHAEHRERLYQQAKRTVSRRALLSQFWSEQNGLCYLCEQPLDLDKAVLEHDHRCCPNMQFCRYCVRGAAHQRCNTIAGYVNDDADQLERIAQNLRRRSAEVEHLQRERPDQPALFASEV